MRAESPMKKVRPASDADKPYRTRTYHPISAYPEFLPLKLSWSEQTWHWQNRGEGGDLKAGSAPTLAVVRAPEPRWLMWGTIVACRVHCGQHQAPIDKWFQDWDYRRAALCRRGAACCSPPLCAAWEDKPGFGVIQNINMSQAAAWDNIAMVNWSNGTWKWYFLETCCTFPCLCLLENFYTEQTKHWSEQSLRLQLQLLTISFYIKWIEIEIVLIISWVVVGLWP